MTPPSADDITTIAITLLAGSELLALTPKIRANSWTQLFLAALRGIAAAQNKREGGPR